MLCKTCQCDLLLGDFYASNKSSCKQCVRAAVRRRARTNPRVQEYDRERAKLPHRVKMRAEYNKRWRAENPDAYRAQTMIGNFLRDGKIKKEPCAICGATKHVHAHHHDYARPLNVTWLCAKCHQRVHAAFPQLGGHYEKRA
jgi:hypothetical protein